MILGVARREYLGYRDSGMAGEESNEDPASFWKADLEEAARRLADLLDEEGAESSPSTTSTAVTGTRITSRFIEWASARPRWQEPPRSSWRPSTAITSGS